MGMVQQVYDGVAATIEDQLPLDRRRILILGDCTFHTIWSSGDNAADLVKFSTNVKASHVDTIDLFGNPTIRHDLHKPVPDEMRGRYDLVIDAGTLFCCFDMSAVWRNILDVLTPDGIVYHHAAMTGYIGRAYYNVHPMLFRDFYAQNGFEILSMKTLIRRHFEERSLWRRAVKRIFRLSNKPQEIGADRPHLIAATWRSFNFSNKQTDVPSILPADAELLCCARRHTVTPFTNAMPPFYA